MGSLNTYLQKVVRYMTNKITIEFFDFSLNLQVHFNTFFNFTKHPKLSKYLSKLFVFLATLLVKVCIIYSFSLFLLVIVKKYVSIVICNVFAVHESVLLESKGNREIFVNSFSIYAQ